MQCIFNAKMLCCLWVANIFGSLKDNQLLSVEQVDRISRLNAKDWETLKRLIYEKNIRVLAIDLPTSHKLIDTSDEFTKRMLSAINAMILDMLAAIVRKDYIDRRKRQAQGVQKAKKLGKYKGRPIDLQLHHKIGMKWSGLLGPLFFFS